MAAGRTIACCADPALAMLHHLPNLISILRILLVPPVAWLILQGYFGEALLLFVVAGVSDGLDGFLAKHFGWTSRLGSILDPLADKLLLSVSFVTLAWLGYLPLWLAALILLRDLVIVIGGVLYHNLVGRFSLEPTIVSKLNTLLQIVVVTLVLVSLAWLDIPQMAIDIAIWLLVLTVVLSGGDYVWTWGRRALQDRRSGG
jgi:cardiolipin synthase